MKLIEMIEEELRTIVQFKEGHKDKVGKIVPRLDRIVSELKGYNAALKEIRALYEFNKSNN